MIKVSDLVKPASVEERAKRKAAYPEVKFKEAVDSVKKTKLVDGTWHIHSNLDVSGRELTTLTNLNISIVAKNFYST